MKKIILIICILFVTKVTNAQTGVPDTLTYLQTIINNKTQFIGQPFSALSNTLQIQVKHFSPFADDHAYKNKETRTGFSFYFPLSTQELYLTYPCLIVKWQSPLNGTISDQIWEANGRGMLLANAAAFYSSAIIKDIYILE